MANKKAKDFRDIPKEEINALRGKGTTLKTLLAAALFMVLGAILTDWSKEAFALISLSISFTLFTAVIVSAIIGSAEFSKIFTNRIYDVMHNPEREINKAVIFESWLKITNVILKSKLPLSFEYATAYIQKVFLKGETKYHYENNKVKVDIIIDENGGIVSTKTETALLVPEENESDFSFIRRYDTNECEVTALMFGGKCISGKIDVTQDEENPALHKLDIPLKQYLEKSTEKFIDIEITTKTKQKINEDPILRATSIRYVKGFELRTKVSKGYKVTVSRNGVGMKPFIKGDKLDGDNFTIWSLPEGEDLVLPGQGYLIVIVPIDD